MSEINTTHDMTNSRLYTIYKGMLGRCYYPSSDRYSCYGARGIKICDEWLINRSKFFEWSLNNGYRENLTIDRIDNDGDYCPENCRWISKEEQYKNRRENIMITYNGKTLCAEDWSKLTGIKAQTIRWRYKHGWEIDKIFNKLPEPYKEDKEMKISIKNPNNPITEFKIRHKGADLNFSWICENPARPFSFEDISELNCCEICIDDVLELENILHMLNRAKKEICGMIGHFE